MTVISKFTGESIIADIIANGGGTYAVERNAHTGSVTITKQNLKHGYMVSRPGTELTLAATEATDGDIGAYVGRNLDALTHLTTYLGAWVEDGTLFLDISDQVSTQNVALFRAVQGNQLAIFDNRNKRVIAVTQADRDIYRAWPDGLR